MMGGKEDCISLIFSHHLILPKLHVFSLFKMTQDINEGWFQATCCHHIWKMSVFSPSSVSAESVIFTDVALQSI